jgi:hypothetical protein
MLESIIKEASLAGYLTISSKARGDVYSLRNLPHSFQFDPAEDLDPVKSATARQINLASGMTTLPLEYSRMGRDWEQDFALGASALGITVEQYQTLIRQKVFAEALAPTTQPVDDSEDVAPMTAGRKAVTV